MASFVKYKPRRVDFQSLEEINGWKVKTYTITCHESFESKKVLDNALNALPDWLDRSKDLGLPTYKSAFLIVHEGRDGVWSLVNWWIGGEMLQSMTYFTPFDDPDNFELLPKEGFMACAWEIPVISFERVMWVEYILQKADKPDFEGYYQNYISRDI